MQYSLQELTDKLLKALDKDNNVVDMPTVLEVLAVLEDYPVTKDSLGQTRVGKYVNEMRRKTIDKDLSRRAKNLVRKWKQLVDAAAADVAMVNGDGITPKACGGSLPRPNLPAHLTYATKPSSPASRPATPSSGKSSVSPSLPSRSRPDTPAASRPSTPSSRVQSPALQTNGPVTPIVPPDSALTRGRYDATPQSTNKAPNQSALRFGPVATSTPMQQQSGLGATESLSKTNSANKKRRRDLEQTPVSNKRLQLSDDSPDGDVGKAKTPRNGLVMKFTNINSDSPTLSDRMLATPSSGNSSRLQRNMSISSLPQKLSTASVPRNLSTASLPRNLSSANFGTPDGRERKPISRTPKVKTTAELIQDMRLDSSDISVKIANNQIEKEADNSEVSIVPAGAKPRPRRKPGTSGNVVPPSTSDKSLSQTKTEMVEKFLQNSYPMSGDQYDRITPSPHNDPPYQPHSPASFDHTSYSGNSTSLRRNGTLNSTLDNQISHVDFEGTHPITFFTDDNKIRTERDLNENKCVTRLSANAVIDPWSLLPPLLPESEIDWSEEPYEPPVMSVTESEIDRLHDQQWAGVNGQYGEGNEWLDWTRTYSVPSFNGDKLHILPYVDIEDE